VQSSEVVLNSLRRMLSHDSISAATSHEVFDDIETMKSIGLCTMHMRRLIDDTINVRLCQLLLTIGIETRKWHAPSHSCRLPANDYRQANPTNL